MRPLSLSLLGGQLLLSTLLAISGFASAASELSSPPTARHEAGYCAVRGNVRRKATHIQDITNLMFYSVGGSRSSERTYLVPIMDPQKVQQTKFEKSSYRYAAKNGQKALFAVMKIS